LTLGRRRSFQQENKFRKDSSILKPMHRPWIFLAATLLVSFIGGAPSASAQAVLPSSFAGWTAAEPSSIQKAAAVNQTLGADAPIFHEYFIQSIEHRTYTQAAQSAEITLYTMRDPSSAYGAYTYLRNDALTPVTIGSFGCASHDRALIVIGAFLLDITGKPARPSDADLGKLAAPIDKISDKTAFPTVGEYLPEDGRVRRSEHYVLGPQSLAKFVPLGTDDWIGFDKTGEVIVARYRVDGHDENLLIASYLTQQIAAERFQVMLRRFTFDPPGAVPPGQTVLFGKRSASIIAIVQGAPSREEANKLLDQVQYQSQVTWSEPKQTLTDPTLGGIVVGAFIGTGIFMMLAFAAGVGFGGIRVLFKIFLPNKVFDREKEIEILQLGIYSKPIRAKDFYQRVD
jgi:hypothetical protein